MPVSELFRRSAGDHRHGATEIERRLLEGLLEVRGEWTRASLRRGAQQLLEGQPLMANLRRLALEMQHADDLDAAQQRWTERLEALHTLGVRLVEHGAALVVACDVVVTISRSAAVRSLVEGVASRGWCGRVVVLDGTVSGRGRDQAAALYEAGLDVRSLPDGAMLEAFDEPASSGLIVVGADAVSSRRFVNAQGTRLLLEVGEALGVRRVVVADSGKDVREADLNAVLTGSRRHWEQGPGRQWPVFEAIPRRLVDHRVSEGGCVSW